MLNKVTNAAESKSEPAQRHVVRDVTRFKRKMRDMQIVFTIM